MIQYCSLTVNSLLSSLTINF